MHLAGCTPDSAATELSNDDIALNNRGVALMDYFDYAGAYESFADLVEHQADWHDARTNLAIAIPEPMAVNAWACRLANYVQQRDVAGAIDPVREVLASYSPSDTILSRGAPANENSRP